MHRLPALLVLVLVLVACGSNPYGYAPEYAPLSEEEVPLEQGIQMSYEDVRRDPLIHADKLVAWFGVVTGVEKADGGKVMVAMNLRFHQPRHLCSDHLDSSCRVTISANHYILGTAGHIDHGKTSLVRALTGIDTDRLPEERRRGMTIELGFAELAIGDVRFGVVDVPGHERFVRTMVAGATGIDVALIVVAADDSVMPQTIEHVEILDLLGVSRAVVAMTKIDMVDSDLVELVVDDVRNLLASTTLRDAAVCPVSSVTGIGLDALRQAILDVVRDIDPVPSAGLFRMAIDRVFAVEGRGTVLTGSALSGALQSGASLAFTNSPSAVIKSTDTS